MYLSYSQRSVLFRTHCILKKLSGDLPRDHEILIDEYTIYYLVERHLPIPIYSNKQEAPYWNKPQPGSCRKMDQLLPHLHGCTLFWRSPGTHFPMHNMDISIQRTRRGSGESGQRSDVDQWRWCHHLRLSIVFAPTAEIIPM